MKGHKAVFINWEGPGYTSKDVVMDLKVALRLLRGYGIDGEFRNEAGGPYNGPINLASYDVGIVLYANEEPSNIEAADLPVSTELDDKDEFASNNAYYVRRGSVSTTDVDMNEVYDQLVDEFPNNVKISELLDTMIELGWVDKEAKEVSESAIHELAMRIPLDPHLILEDIESDLQVFVNMNVTKLRVKEQAFEIGQTTWDDPGDYPSAMGGRALPSHEYVEEIYGAAELAFDIPIENIPPNIHWSIEHTEAKVRQYKMEGQHVQQISSTTAHKALGMLVFSDDQGGEARADARLLQDALDEELYRVKQDLDELMLPPEFNQTYTLQIQWVHWEQAENKLTCTLGVTAELD